MEGSNINEPYDRNKKEFIEIVNFIENKEIDYNERLKVSLNALKKYNSLPKFEKDCCKFECYRINIIWINIALEKYSYFL